MSIKILGGVFKHFSLKVPIGPTRPTSVILRRKIFDKYQNLSNHIFIDACAGSGAMGIEALSRGAEKIYFIEKSPNALKILKQNMCLLATKFFPDQKSVPWDLIGEDFSRLIKSGFIQEMLKNQSSYSNIIFFDPPYKEHDMYYQVENELLTQTFKGQIWIESDELVGISASHWEKYKSLNKIIRQGKSYLAIFICE